MKKRAALKARSEKIFSIDQARAYSKKLIKKMGFRKIVMKQSVAESIAEISWYLGSEGLLATAEKFSDDVYDFIA